MTKKHSLPLLKRIELLALASWKAGHVCLDHPGDFEDCRMPACVDGRLRVKGILAEVRALQGNQKRRSF